MMKQAMWGALALGCLVMVGCGGATKEAPEANNEVNNGFDNNDNNLPEPDCVRDSDCPGELFCDNGECVEGECERDADCPAGQVCLLAAGVCVEPQCLQNAECPEGQYCDPEDRKCKEGCVDSSNCPEGELCNPNTQACEPDAECADDSDCGERQVCRDDKCFDVDCVRDADCIGAGEFCNTDSNTCELTEGFCTSDLDCEDGFRCDVENNTCEEIQCPECPEGTFCNEEVGECWECVTDEDCGEGGECDLAEHVCIDTRCQGDEDCGEGEFCDRITGECELDEECQDDNFEPNNAQEEARALGEGEFEGLSVCEGDEDWFDIELQAGDGLEIAAAFSHAAGNLDIELFDPTLRRVAAGTSSNDDERIFTEGLSRSGIYKLRVFGVEGVENKSYSLSVVIDTTNRPVCSDDNFEENDDAEQAAETVPGEFADLSVCPGDVDFFAVALERGQTMTVSLTFSHEAGDLDLQILAPGGEEVLAESVTADDNEEATTPAIEVSGDVLIRVSGATPAVTNVYDLSITTTEAPQPCEDDTLEPNDAREDAGTVAPGLISDLRLCPGDEDWFAIGLNAGDDIRVELNFSHDAGDLDLLLFAPDVEMPLAASRTRNDDEGVGFTDVPVSGVYHIRVLGAEPEVENDYLMIIERTEPPTECEDDELEDNDNTEQPAPFPGGEVVGQICSGDEDWFSVQGNAGGTMNVELEYILEDGNLNLQVFDPNGVSIGLSASEDSDTDTVAVAELPVSGRYLVRVFGPRGSESLYTLSATTTEPACPDDAQEDNDDPESATLVDLSDGSAEFIAQRICSRDDDWYAVDLSVGDGLSASLFFVDGDGDLDLQILDEEGRRLASSVSINDNEEATVGSVEAAGLYFVRVYGFLGAEGEYELSFTRIDGGTDCEDDTQEPNDSVNRARVITPGTFNNLQLCPTDEDWYAVELAEGEILDVALSFVDADGDVDIEVQDPNEARIATGFTVTDDERVTLRARTAGLHLIRVFSFSPTIDNGYGMTVDVLSADNCLEDDFEENDTAEDAARIFTGATTGLGLCQEDGQFEDDWFRFTVGEVSDIEAIILFSHEVGDLDMELYEEGSMDPLDGSYSFRDSETVLGAGVPPGTYLLRIFSVFDARLINEYDLNLTVERVE